MTFAMTANYDMILVLMKEIKLAEEIDLRPFIKAIIKGWKWIVGIALMLGILAFWSSSTTPPQYEATALVVTISRDIVQLDSQFLEEPAEGNRNSPPPYAQIATSDHVLEALLLQISSDVNNINTISKLKASLKTVIETSSGLIRLSVVHGNPEIAADIANSWAKLFVSRTSEIYGDSGEDQLLIFKAQLQEVEEDLVAAEQALIDFESSNRLLLIQTELESLILFQGEQLELKQQILPLYDDIAGLQSKLSNKTIPISFADQLTALSFQMKAFDVAEDGPLLMFQVGSEQPLTSESDQELQKSLDDLLIILDNKLENIDNSLNEIEPQIFTLQKELREIETDHVRLTRELTIAEDVYNALARRVEEEQINSQDNTISNVRLASQAAVPDVPLSNDTLTITALSSISGLGLAIFYFLAAQWWTLFKANDRVN